jgi:hypothetical protein
MRFSVYSTDNNFFKIYFFFSLMFFDERDQLIIFSLFTQ